MSVLVIIWDVGPVFRRNEVDARIWMFARSSVENLMLKRYLLLLLCFLAAGWHIPAGAAVELSDVPAVLGAQYDLVWDANYSSLTGAALVLEISGKEGAYQLRIDGKLASWQPKGATATASAALTLKTGVAYAFSLKRRPGAVALLMDSRLLFSAPAPSLSNERLAVTQAPGGTKDTEITYVRTSPSYLGDDFMRQPATDARGRLLYEDTIWNVASPGKPNPAERIDPLTGVLPDPWRLSTFPVVASSANGFWLIYTGIGPSWVVANDTMAYSTWDRYSFQAAVQPEYDSAVGLIAAYQDNKNFLLFRWRSRDVQPKNKEGRAQLLAYIDGKERILAESAAGYNPGQWYQVRMNLGWHRVEVLLDGQPLLAANNPGPVQGRVGFYADGVEKPRKPKVDELTSTMYIAIDETTLNEVNDAADAMSTISTVRFDDVKVRAWNGIEDLQTAPYLSERKGSWQAEAAGLRARTPGQIIVTGASWDDYEINTRLQLAAGSSAGLYLHLDAAQNGYAWVLNASGQQLVPVSKGVRGTTALARSTTAVKAGVWSDVRVVVHGAHLACYVDGAPVLDYYDARVSQGRVGLFSTGAGTLFAPFTLQPYDKPLLGLNVHETFETDRYMISWSGAESDWYPFPDHRRNIRVVDATGRPVVDAGPAVPRDTSVPGLYWNKGGHYHDVRVTLALQNQPLDGQTIHLSTNYQDKAGYRLRLTQETAGATATLYRKDAVIGTSTFERKPNMTLVFERQGSYLLLFARWTEEVPDPEDADETMEVDRETRIFGYRDEAPIKAEMIGFTVTTSGPAAKFVQVESERVQDAFEESPVHWSYQSGIWGVMARYSCQPQWNWYGGFGAGAPTVWYKNRLDGDQNVEVYMGIKMQYDNMTEREQQRFRDMNVTICSNGANVFTGYTLIRAGRPNGVPTTMLLRNGVVVQQSTLQADLLPFGHRQWYSTRLEKRGAEIKVFIDNRLAMTYLDPQPISGGHFGIWTLNNGLMIARVNVSADKVSPGNSRAAAPLVVQEELPALPKPVVTVNGKPALHCSFEADFDGWKSRGGFSGALVRERVTTAQGKQNTFMKIVNSYPAGDFSAALPLASVDLQATPVLSMEYNFDKGARVNLYFLYNRQWYELLLTGDYAMANAYTISKGDVTRFLKVEADGAWHTLQLEVISLLREAIRARTGAVPDKLVIDEMVIADWSRPQEMRLYGNNINPGGMAIRLDNVTFQAVK